MPATPLRPCRRPGCAAFAAAESAFCTLHAPAARAAVATQRAALDEHRGSAHARGYDGRWAAVSRAFRQAFPLSPGYLTRTPFWTHLLATEFHTLRTFAAQRGQYLAFFSAGAAGDRFLEQYPIYEFHGHKLPVPSEVTDHIIPHRGDQTLFWSEWNLQAIGEKAHNEKTARFDGGFRGAPASPLAS